PGGRPGWPLCGWPGQTGSTETTDCSTSASKAAAGDGSASATSSAAAAARGRRSAILVGAVGRRLALRRLVGRHAISALHPAAEIDVGTALRAEGAEAVHRRRLADGAASAR